MAIGKVNMGGGSATLNVYTGLTEPQLKEGIWIKTATNVSKIKNDLEIWFENSWNDPEIKPHTPIPYKMSHIRAVVVGSKIYVIGGTLTAGYNGTTDKNLCFDTVTETWTEKSPIPTRRLGHALVAVGTDIYLFGGSSATNTESALATCFKYNTLTDTWTSIADMPSARMYSGYALVDNKVYIIAGQTTSSLRYNDTYCYDIATDTWTTLADMPSTKQGGWAYAVGSEIHHINGYQAPNGGEHYKYDTVTNTWTTLPQPPFSGRYFYGFVLGSKLYVIGGDTAMYYVYDTTTGLWSSIPAPPVHYNYSFGAYYNNRLYMFGGALPSTSYPTDTVRSFDFQTKEFDRGTVIIYRNAEDNGVYHTELVTPSVALEGVNSRMTTAFDDVYFYDTKLEQYLPTYYGDGTKWVQFK